MRNIITRFLISMISLALVMTFDPGIRIYASGSEYVITLALVAFTMGVVNAVIRPIILFFAWPINCLTFGLFGFAINVSLFWLIGMVVPHFRILGPIQALIGFVIMGIISGLLNFALKDS